MSLGWQTESALLPSKAKPIHVDSKSMVGLKSIVFDEEERLRSKFIRDEAHGGFKSHRGERKDGKRKDVFEKINSGVNDRSRRDKSESSRLSESDKVYSALKAKSELYEQLQQSGISNANDAFLVDFSTKKGEREALDLRQQHISSLSSSQVNIDDGDYSEIEDEFGRTKRIHRRSKDYSELLLARELKRRKKNRWEKPALIDENDEYLVQSQSSEAPLKSEWSWSKGQCNKTEDDTSQLISSDSKAKFLLSHLVESELRSAETGRVKTQWERVLNGTSREYLDEVHEEALFGRKDVSCTGSRDSSYKCFNDNIGVDCGGRNSVREDRLLKIKLLQEKKKKKD